MTTSQRLHAWTMACVTVGALLGHAAIASAQTSTPPVAPTAAAAATTEHDGQRDFDWMVGSWKATLKRLVKPLSGSTTWVELEGTQTTKHIWGGRGVMDEFSVNNPTTNTRVDGLTVRLYNPKSRQWHIYWANANNGTFTLPATVGGFKNGRGEFYDHEEWEGRMILVRYVWSDITPSSAHFEQAFSVDGGRTWEVNWISDITRVKSSS